MDRVDHTNAEFSRRRFLAAASLGAAVAVNQSTLLGGETAEASKKQYRFCAFDKFLNHLSHEQLADSVADMGFDGVETTVRKGGRIEPDNVDDELPRLVAALAARDLTVMIMTTDVNRADDRANERVLTVAAKLGIQRYRLGWFTYDNARKIPEQLASYRLQAAELAALNRELGITGLWQNHCGPEYVGATIWDVFQVLQNVAPHEIGVAFDIRHATVESGRSWSRLYQLIKPHIGALYMKDFVWDGQRDKHVPLGEGRVDPAYFEMLQRDQLDVPISVHVEYLTSDETQENLRAIGRDFQRLKQLLQDANSKS